MEKVKKSKKSKKSETEKKKSKIPLVKGMLDIMPADVLLWHQFEETWRALVASYGYEEIRFPVVEYTSLFKRTIGEVTDIVEKEMFTFKTNEDKQSMSLRPEGTAGCVRAIIDHTWLRHHLGHRFWYMGPMFRHETSQLGRYRQFYQVGIETFGLEGPDIEVEHLLMMNRFFHALGIEKAVTLEINSLGSKDSRDLYRKEIVEYFTQHKNILDKDNLNRLEKNPLRILDSKQPELKDIIKGAPNGLDYLDEASRLHFEKLKDCLSVANIAYVVNPSLVRGLDYYNRTVYEWVTDQLGAQGTVCAGGRYDGLMKELGGEPTPAVGFAMGIERAILVQQALKIPKPSTPLDAYLIHVGEGPEKDILLLAETFRNAYPKLRLLVNLDGGTFKKQFEKADESGAKIAFILGETEWSTKTVGIKFLRENKPQLTLPQAELGSFLTEYFGR